MKMPGATDVLKIAAAVWVLFLAAKLWAVRVDERGTDEVIARNVYLTTVLNPKALILGLVLLPAPQDTLFLPRLCLFSIMVPTVALVWGWSGWVLAGRTANELQLLALQRIASIWLGIVSLTLIVGVLKT